MLRITKKLYSILTKKQRKIIIVLGFLMLIGGLLESVSVSLILPLITGIVEENTWSTTWYAVLICKLFGISNQYMYIKVLLILVAIAFLLKNIYLLGEYFFQYSFTAKSRIAIQQKLMSAYLYKPYKFFLYASSGEIIRILNDDVKQAFILLSSVLLFFTEAVVVVALGVTIVIMSPLMALILGIMFCFEFFFITSIIKSRMRKIGIRTRKASALANKWMLQGINGIKSIKVATKEDFFEKKFSKYTEVVADGDCKNQTLSNSSRLFIEAFTVGGVMLVLLIMVCAGADLEDIIPQLSAFAVATIRLLPSVNRISIEINRIPFYEGGLDNVIEHLKEQELQEEVLQKKSIILEEKEISFDKKLEFSHISFCYEGSNKLIFEDASFEIKKGQSIGIVGNSGAGKTTAIDIILGLLKPDSGKVFVDGVDIEENMAGWLRSLSYIPQSIFLIDDTIRANVAFGIDKNNCDDNAVWEALRDAQMETFVKELPDGLDTIMGEAGIRLSGGQRQRLGIARALYSNPKILFFDEATSALDNETEAAIMEAIENLRGDKTLVIIAHRLSTIVNCDVVYRVENGKVVQER